MIYRVFMSDEDYVVIDADSPEEAMLKLRDAGLEPVKAEPFLVQSNGLILEQLVSRFLVLLLFAKHLFVAARIARSSAVTAPRRSHPEPRRRSATA